MRGSLPCRWDLPAVASQATPHPVCVLSKKSQWDLGLEHSGVSKGKSLAPNTGPMAAQRVLETLTLEFLWSLGCFQTKGLWDSYPCNCSPVSLPDLGTVPSQLPALGTPFLRGWLGNRSLDPEVEQNARSHPGRCRWRRAWAAVAEVGVGGGAAEAAAARARPSAREPGTVPLGGRPLPLLLSCAPRAPPGRQPTACPRGRQEATCPRKECRAAGRAGGGPDRGAPPRRWVTAGAPPPRTLSR